MSATKGTGPAPEAMYASAEDRADLLAYWELYERNHKLLSEQLTTELEDHPDFGPIMKSMTPAQMEAQSNRSVELQRAAFVDGAWGPWLDDLRMQGIGYARMGLAFTAWFQLIAMIRTKLSPLAFKEYAEEPVKLAQCLNGLGKLVDITMSVIGDAYLDAKQSVIGDQAMAIRELSIPVLQVRSRLLLLPLIGVLDTHRARQLTEDLLNAIRANRAKAVVIDITGVAAVDSRVANHLLQTIDAARLMGATVVVTGISPEVAQALVALGEGLGRLHAVGDLEEGIGFAERFLGFEVTQGEPGYLAALDRAE
jgi:rsbT co-antagonist protein RsbR